MPLVFVVLVALIALSLARGLTRIGEHRTSTAAGATLLVLGVLPSVLGAPFHDVGVGLLLTAILCAPLLRLGRARWHAPAIGVPALAVSGGLFMLLTWTSLTTWIWDERSTHWGLSAAVARGALPPFHPQFPDTPFRYHVGFDVIAGALRRFTDLHVDLCIDIVSIAVAVVLLWALAEAGHALGGRFGAALAPAVVLLGYGPASLCLDVVFAVEPTCREIVPATWRHPLYIPPPVISKFFQHPQALGMIALIVLPRLLLQEKRAPFVVGCALLALASQAHVIAFGLLGLGAALWWAWRALKERAFRPLVLRWSALLGALVLAGVLGGFVGALMGASEVRPGFIWTGHFSAAFRVSLLEAFAMNALVFTPVLVALPVGAWRAWRTADPLRALLLLMTVFGFVLPNLISYERSWDIVKLFGVAALCANLILVDALAFLAERRRAIATMCALLLCLAGGTWLLRYSVLNGVIAIGYHERAPAPIAVALDAAAGDLIGTEVVLTHHVNVQELGFGVFGFDWRQASGSYLLDRELRDRQLALRQRALQTFLPEDLAATGAGFVLLSERELQALAPDVAARVLALPEAALLNVEGELYSLRRLR